MHIYLTRPHWINLPPPSASYMHQWTGSSLVQVMACRLFGTKPLPEPMLAYGQLNTWKQISVKFESEFCHLHSRKWIWKCFHLLPNTNYTTDFSPWPLCQQNDYLVKTYLRNSSSIWNYFLCVSIRHGIRKCLAGDDQLPRTCQVSFWQKNLMPRYCKQLHKVHIFLVVVETVLQKDQEVSDL